MRHGTSSPRLKKIQGGEGRCRGQASSRPIPYFA
uniref:Uncharacterized protein n=1 Tax=Setaria viridis TaxID=4556 RepID=A0A4U6UI18_SETVI|nr:hypothetical protein SEVIR_5G214740v2 [Setaria viridis]